MKKKLGLLLLTLLFSASLQAKTLTSNENGDPFFKDPLKNLISSKDKRYITFRYALDLMKKRKVKTIVETGTARNGDRNAAGDGASTLIWGNWAKRHHAFSYSVDIDPDAIANAQEACSNCKDHVAFFVSDSIAFLKDFGKPIDFLYLDSFDFDFSNPTPSQEHHLKEIIAAKPFLHKKSIVMIDDCGITFGGKGKLAIDYLINRGWKVALSAYQVVLVYDKTRDKNSNLKK